MFRVVTSFILFLAFAAPASSPAFAAIPDTGRPEAVDGNVPYVVITSQSLRGPFLRFAKWKGSIGTRTAVRSVESIRSAYPVAADDAERIRLFLKDAHATWNTRWVLLGGDVEEVPTRFVTVHFFPPDRRFASDFYFACLDGNWNADGDSLYGEDATYGDPGDDPDLVPELFVGRAPVRNSVEVARFIDRTIEAAMGGSSSGARVLAFAGTLGPPTNSFDLASLVEPSLELLSQAKPTAAVTRLYKNAPAWPGSYPLSVQALHDSLDDGFDLVLGFVAGGPTVLMAGSQVDPADAFEVDDALSLAMARPSHVWLATSLVGDITQPTSLGEAFMRAGRGAATMAVPTDLNLAFAGRGLMLEFVRLVVEEHAPMGEAVARQGLGSNDPMSRRTYVLLGDPQAGVPLAPARALEVAHAASCAARGSFEVRVAAGGVAEAGVRVVLWRDDDQEGLVGETDADGRTVLTVGDGGPPYTLTVMARDARPYQTDIPVTDPVGVGPAVPAEMAFAIPEPNPARATARFALDVPRTLDGAALELAVFDLAGRVVRVLDRSEARVGRRALSWDLRDTRGRRVPDGVYQARLTVGGKRLVRSIAVLR